MKNKIIITTIGTIISLAAILFGLGMLSAFIKIINIAGLSWITLLMIPLIILAVSAILFVNIVIWIIVKEELRRIKRRL